MDQGLRVLLLHKHDPPHIEDPFVDAQLHELSKQLYATWKYAPVSRLGELHCILSNASYYALLDNCVVSPALLRGELVIVDGWYYKLASRVQHNGAGSMRDALPYFGGIRIPDQAVLLNVNPSLAADRNGRFTGGETGFANSGRRGSPVEFISYQAKVGDSLQDFARRLGWYVIDNNAASVIEVAETLTGILPLMRTMPCPR